MKRYSMLLAIVCVVFVTLYLFWLAWRNGTTADYAQASFSAPAQLTPQAAAPASPPSVPQQHPATTADPVPADLSMGKGPQSPEAINLDKVISDFEVNKATQVTDLNFQQVKKAYANLAVERRMWNDITTITADITFKSYVSQGDTPGELGARLAMKSQKASSAEFESKRVLFQDTITLTSIDGTWTITSDGTSPGPKIQCSDPARSNAVKQLICDNQLIQFLTMPRDLLLPLYTDDLYPSKRRSGISAIVPAQDDRNKSVPDSFMYRVPTAKGNLFSFDNKGHFNRWTYDQGQNNGQSGGGTNVLFEEYVELAGFSYPSRISIERTDGTKLHEITLRNIAINN